MKEAEIRPRDLFNRYLELSRRDVERLFTDRTGFVAVECPACGSGDAEPGLEKLSFRYVLCRPCGTLYASPRPAPDQLARFYRDADSVRFWSTHFYRETEDARREKMFRPRAALVAEILGDRAGEGTFVDIGSGYGIFLEEIARLSRFERIVGVEPNPELAAICRSRGFHVIEQAAEVISPGELHADFATAFEVLEHVYSPLAFLEAVRRVLKTGGRFLFTTLTASGFDIQVLWDASKSVSPPHHINFISVEGMRRLVERAGFRLVELSTPGALDVDIVANTLRERPDLAVPRFVRYLVESRDHAAREQFQQFLRCNLLSSHLRVIATTATGHT